MSEAAQLNRDDFECHCPIWLVTITEFLDDDEVDSDQYPVKPDENGEVRSTKNENSERILPIPSILIEEGFIDFVKNVKRVRIPMKPAMHSNTKILWGGGWRQALGPD